MAETRTSDALVCTDQATTHDRLGFGPYRDTLVEVIRRAETPLTVGVFGAWGSGKTSLLLMLQDALQAGWRTRWLNLPFISCRPLRMVCRRQTKTSVVRNRSA